VLVRQLSIDEIPLGLERAPEDRIASLVGRRFQLIEGCLQLQRSDVGGREIEGRKFSHLIRGRIIDTADQHTNMSHRALPGHCKGAIVPQLWLVPDYNLTQRLFVLAHFVRPHVSLRQALVYPLERGGKRQSQRERQRKVAMAAGQSSRRWTVREVLMLPLPQAPSGSG
jgi:hypothetical protein